MEWISLTLGVTMDGKLNLALSVTWNSMGDLPCLVEYSIRKSQETFDLFTHFRPITGSSVRPQCSILLDFMFKIVPCTIYTTMLSAEEHTVEACY